MDVAPVVALGSNVIRVAMEFWLRRQKSRRSESGVLTRSSVMHRS